MRCGVAVLQFSKGYSYTRKYFYIYIYINIDLIFDFWIINFGTATLQRCNNCIRKIEKINLVV